ncbi:SMP-30/gluconolactonase/LRE family protein [bacterium]|nr:SMP-30/gluconolactonase/LRE family protein [bacterium]
MRRFIALVLSGLLLAGCRLPTSGFLTMSPTAQPGGQVADEARSVLQGQVFFAGRAAQATIEDVAVAATVSLINSATNETVMTGLTDERGRFTITLPKAFRPDHTATYFLEAAKGLNDNQPGSAMARVRTIAKFAEGGWVSLSNATPNGGIVLSPATTAIALGAALRNGTDDEVELGTLIGKLSGSTFTPVPNLSASDFTALVGIVSQALLDEKDPVRFTGLDVATDTWKALERFAPLLAVTGVTPSSGVVGTPVTFTGSSFNITPASNIIRFNGAPAPAETSTGTAVTVHVPQGASSGETTVQVGNIITMGPIFTVPVVVSGFAPASAAPGTTVTLTGAGFDMATLSNNAVRFTGNALGTVTAASETTLKVTVPSGAVSGPLNVSVSGTSTITASPLAVPVSVTGLNPFVVQPNGTFTVSGTGFGSTAASVSVSVGGNAFSVLAASPTALTVKAPGAEMVGPLSVQVEGQTGVSPMNLRVFVGLASNALIQKFAGGATLPPAGVAATNWGVDSPRAVVRDPQGNTYFTAGNCVYKVNAAHQLSVFAGTGVMGSDGDGGLATAAQLSAPYGLALDAAGNMYIADSNNYRVRKVAPNGIITTYAGSTYGFSGDGGAATAAQMKPPYSLALDGTGNLYIADSDNARIRKVDPDGLITTVAGRTGASYGGDGGLATNAYLSSPNGVAADATGNLYIADSSNNRIRKVALDGTITTVVGSGTKGYSGDGGPATGAALDFPRGVTLDAAGNLYIADYSNHCVRKVTPGGTISTVAGSGVGGYGGDGGQAVAANLYYPNAVSVDAAGNLYIADGTNYRVRTVSAAGVITTLAGTGSNSYGGDGLQATIAQMKGPSDAALDAAGNLYVAEYQNHVIRKVTPEGIVSTVAGTGTLGFSGDGGPATSAQLYNPTSIALDGAGNLYIADYWNHRVRKVSGGTVTTVAGTGDYGYSGDGEQAVNAQLYGPRGLALDGAGNLYIADALNNRIRKVDAAGIITTVAGTGAAGFSGDGFQATSAKLNAPYDVALDGAGNCYIADYNNHCIRKVTPGGGISTVAGSSIGYSGDGGPATLAQLSRPRNVALDIAGHLFITDSGNNRIRKVDTTGVISTIAGTGTVASTGDGGAATSAGLALYSRGITESAGLAVSSDGRVLFVPDPGGHRVRRIQ